MQLSHMSVGVMENRVSVMVPEKGTRHSNRPSLEHVTQYEPAVVRTM